MFDLSEIERYIPHRRPFLFLDAVVDFEEGRRARGVFRVSGEEPYFEGHFPSDPVVPGVLILEHMAQTANFLVARSADDAQVSTGGVLAGVDRARFVDVVTPPAVLTTDVTLVKLLPPLGLVEAQTRVDDREVARARIQFAARGSGARQAG